MSRLMQYSVLETQPTYGLSGQEVMICHPIQLLGIPTRLSANPKYHGDIPY